MGLDVTVSWAEGRWCCTTMRDGVLDMDNIPIPASEEFTEDPEGGDKALRWAQQRWPDAFVALDADST